MHVTALDIVPLYYYYGDYYKGEAQGAYFLVIEVRQPCDFLQA